MQAAHLTWQQLLRGINIKIALRNSFSDVYIKPRNGADFTSNVNTSLAEMKNNIFKSLNELISAKTLEYSGSQYPRHVQTVNGLCTNSSLDTVKQMSYPVHCLIQNENSSKKLPNVNLYALFLFFNTYQICPVDSCKFLQIIIKRDLTYNNNIISNLKDLMSKYNETANNFRSKLKSFTNSNLYEPYYPEHYRVNEQKRNEINLNILILYEDLVKAYLDYSDKKVFSVLDYSKAVSNGSLSDDFADYPILKQCSKYVAYVNKIIRVSLFNNNSNLNNGNTCRIIKLLNWRNRFVRICSEPIFVSDDKKRRPVLREDILTLLRIHCKWLTKYLMSELFDIVMYSKLAAFEKETKSMMATNEEYIDTSKLSKKIRKCYIQPKLYLNKEEYDLCASRTDIYKNVTLRMNQPLGRQLNKLTLDISSLTDWSLALDVPNQDKLVIIQNNLNKLLLNPVETTSENIKLLPIISYVTQRVINIILSDLLKLMLMLPHLKGEKILPKGNFIVILTNLVQLGKNIQGVSPALLNLFEVLKRISENSEEIIDQR